MKAGAVVAFAIMVIVAICGGFALARMKAPQPVVAPPAERPAKELIDQAVRQAIDTYKEETQASAPTSPPDSEPTAPPPARTSVDRTAVDQARELVAIQPGQPAQPAQPAEDLQARMAADQAEADKATEELRAKAGEQSALMNGLSGTSWILGSHTIQLGKDGQLTTEGGGSGRWKPGADRVQIGLETGEVFWVTVAGGQLVDESGNPVPRKN